jgi:hypothetical protein
MNVFQIEQFRLKLHEEISEAASVNVRICLIYNFFESLLLLPASAAVSYYHEFLSTYLNLLQKYEAFYKKPEQTENIISQLKNLSLRFEDSDEIRNVISSLDYKLLQLQRSLTQYSSSTQINRVSFPVLEKSPLQDLQYGFLETLSVEIKKSSAADVFLIIPSEQEIDNKLLEQINISWQVALNVLRRYFRRIHKNHKIIISFDNRLGSYVGSSLGTALTLAFIEELFSFYNANRVIKTEGSSAFSGSLDIDGSIVSVSNEIIAKKTEIIFFSGVQKFIIPEPDKKSALEKVNEFKSLYPLRKLEIIGVTDFEDLLNRRNIVSIERKSIVVRSKKLLKKQWFLISLILINLLLLYFSGLWDFDNNPASLENTGTLVKVLNKNGKVLWQEELGYDPSTISHSTLKLTNQFITDINEDGINEVLLLPQITFQNEDFGTLFCYDNKKNIIWKNKFEDTVSVFAEHVTPTYRSRIIGVAEYNDEKLLFLFALHNPYATSAIFSVNLKSGERRGGVLWHHGHFVTGLVDDFNEDGKTEIVLLGVNNCFERSVLLSIDIDKINGRAPSRKIWEYYGHPPADFNKYILLPKSDLNDYLRIRYNHPATLNFDETTKEFFFHLNENNERTLGINYNCDNKLNNIRPVIVDQFQVARDSMVASGVLNPPYTETFEFFNYLSSQIKDLAVK